MVQQRMEGIWVRLISAQVLDSYIRFREHTNRSLAERMGSAKYRSTISHLRSGARTTCGPEIARKIEKALEAPTGSLFVAEVATASSGTTRRGRVA